MERKLQALPFFAAPEITINGSFEVAAGNCLEFSDKGCQYTGIIDCDPQVNTTSGGGTCAAPYAMVCGTMLQRNSTQNNSIWSSYGINTGWSGPEAVFTLEQPEGSITTITLDQLQADLDLILIQPCTNNPLFLVQNQEQLKRGFQLQRSQVLEYYMLLLMAMQVQQLLIECH